VETPGTLFPTPVTSSVVCSHEDSRNREEEPETLNQQMKEISKWKTQLISCAAQAKKP